MPAIRGRSYPKIMTNGGNRFSRVRDERIASNAVVARGEKLVRARQEEASEHDALDNESGNDPDFLVGTKAKESQGENDAGPDRISNPRPVGRLQHKFTRYDRNDEIDAHEDKDTPDDMRIRLIGFLKLRVIDAFVKEVKTREDTEKAEQNQQVRYERHRRGPSLHTGCFIIVESKVELFPPMEKAVS
jgi:hypothetical protein